MEPDNHKLFDIPSDQFTILGDFKLYSSSGKCDGPCRLVHRDGDTIVGFFKDGQSDSVTYYKAYQNFLKGRWRNNRLQSDDSGQIYSYRGKLDYAGGIRDGKRHGKGKEYQLGRLKFEGQWKDDVKDGYFIQHLFEDDKQVAILQGSYTNGRRHGPFYLTYTNDTEEDTPYNYQDGVLEGEQPQQQQAKKYAYPNDVYKYSCHVTPYEFELLKNSVYMIDTGVLSMFGQTIFQHLQAQSFHKQTNNTTIIFPVRFTQHFAGHHFGSSKYEPVQPICRHLTGNFSIVSGFYHKLYFPLISHNHFTLAVVTVNQFKFSMQYFDSMHGEAYYKNQMLKGLLMCQYEKHYQKKDPRIEAGIRNMQYKCNKKCASQYDGVSCGVFVCKYIYQLTMLGGLRQTNTHSYIKYFRMFIADVLASDISKFTELMGKEVEQHKQIELHKNYK